MAITGVAVCLLKFLHALSIDNMLFDAYGFTYTNIASWQAEQKLVMHFHPGYSFKATRSYYDNSQLL